MTIAKVSLLLVPAEGPLSPVLVCTSIKEEATRIDDFRAGMVHRLDSRFSFPQNKAAIAGELVAGPSNPFQILQIIDA